MSNLTMISNPKVFFEEEILKASRKQGFTVEPFAQVYLVDLLYTFITDASMKILVSQEEEEVQVDLLGTPITFLYKMALEAEKKDEKKKIWKALGDTTLYVSGYFSDYFDNKAFSVDFFMDLGAKAYGELSTFQKKENIYGYLSKNFASLAELLAYMGDAHHQSSEKDILALYTRWLHNPSSQRLRKKLEESGILPTFTSKTFQ